MREAPKCSNILWRNLGKKSWNGKVGKKLWSGVYVFHFFLHLSKNPFPPILQNIQYTPLCNLLENTLNKVCIHPCLKRKDLTNFKPEVRKQYENKPAAESYEIVKSRTWAVFKILQKKNYQQRFNQCRFMTMPSFK